MGTHLSGNSPGPTWFITAGHFPWSQRAPYLTPWDSSYTPPFQNLCRYHASYNHLNNRMSEISSDNDIKMKAGTWLGLVSLPPFIFVLFCEIWLPKSFQKT